MRIMRVVTIAREYGAGGGELARKLASALGWELCDRELLHEAARLQAVPEAELELHDEQAVGFRDRIRLHPTQEQYLLGLTAAVQNAAARGNVVLVGRGTAHLLSDAEACCHVRLVAPLEWRAARVAQLMNLSLEDATARCAREDLTRKKFNRYFFGPGADQSASYDLVINTARFTIDETVSLLRDLVTSTEPFQPPRHGSYAVLTLARELGAGEQGFAPPLAERLGLQVLDRELLEEESRELGIPVAEVGRLDEMPAGILQRFCPGSIQHRYVDLLERLMRQYATRGKVLILGRGGFVFLRDHPTAFHVRLVAPMPVRVRRMMEYRWVREDVARRLLTQSDVRRRTFCLDFLSADWVSPLEYHLTVNTGRLGLAALDAVSNAATRYWARTRAVLAATDQQDPKRP
jgi:cytidylate kinase